MTRHRFLLTLLTLISIISLSVSISHAEAQEGMYLSEEDTITLAKKVEALQAKIAFYEKTIDQYRKTLENLRDLDERLDASTDEVIRRYKEAIDIALEREQHMKENAQLWKAEAESINKALRSTQAKLAASQTKNTIYEVLLGAIAVYELTSD